MYRRGLDSHHIFAVDEFYWEDRPHYHAALEAVRRVQTPTELRAALKVSKQGALDLLRPLMEAGLVRRVGTLKTGRYVPQ